MPLALLVVGFSALVLAWLVHHPLRRPGELAAPMFFAAWLGGEFPLHAAALFGGAGLALVLAGALAEPAGVAGLIALSLAALGPLQSWRQASELRGQLQRALGREVAGSASFWRYLVPLYFRDRDILCTPSIVDADSGLRADVWRRRTPSPHPRPMLVYVHGGAWVIGFRRWQGRLLIRRLVRAGWVAVSVQYRLSPWATWPTHIVDVKRAIAWARRMAPSWNADPERVALSGNSAGGHLASLAAFSSGYRAWQPGFEEADTRVHALVGWYGVYDLVAACDGSGLWPHRAMHRLWRLMIMKKSLARAPEDYRLASPSSHFGEHVPPTLLVHGALDTMVPVQSARAFVARCEAQLPGRVRYLEVTGAQHAFDVFYSRRAVHTVEATALWLESVLDGSGDYQE